MAVGAVSAAVEHVLELRDAARLTATETFYAEGARRIRYHLTSPDAPGPTLVLLDGGHACLEQWRLVQAALTTVAPVLSYDRGGTGFSDLADAHDANAEADELDRLLHAPEFTGPFVLVSFSSSAPLATVFAAKHFELVKGIVFVDPSLSATPGAKSWRRVLWRVNVVNPLQALFGYMRMQRAIVDRHAPPSSPESERLSAILNSTHHWIASTEESMALDESAEEANAAIATRPFGELPLGVLTTADPAKSELLRDIFDRQKRLAANSERGILRAVHSVHSQLLKDPVTVGSIIDLIRTIADEARGDMTGAQ